MSSQAKKTNPYFSNSLMLSSFSKSMHRKKKKTQRKIILQFLELKSLHPYKLYTATFFTLFSSLTTISYIFSSQPQTVAQNFSQITIKSKIKFNCFQRFHISEERESKSSEEAMERDEEGRFTSCWGRLKVMIPWMRGRRRRANHLLRRQGNNNGVGCGITTSILTTTSDKSKTAGIFRYSPLSYAQNFDHGCPLEDDEDSAPLRFSTRYAAASSTKSSQGR